MSAVTLSETDSSARHEGSRRQRIREHFAQEWASALLVASIVTVAHLHFHLLRAFDTYTYLTLGQMSSISVAGSGKQYRTVVVEIDDATFEKEFEERTPLNRTQLRKHLEAIYGAGPDIVVVDLDLSPELHPLDKWATKAGACTASSIFPEPTEEETKVDPEASLYKLIRDKAKGPTPITTVLLEPFETTNVQLYCWRQKWQAWMEESPHVSFGNGEVPVPYGVHTELSAKPDALVKVVERHATGNATATGEDAHARKLDPRQLRRGVQVMLLSGMSSAEALTTRLQFELEDAAKQNPHKKKVVFFGAGYGSDDLFLSAVGDIYGVEAHAAGYVSDSVRDNHVVDFVLDLLIALMFSLAIALFWRKYFDARLSDNVVTRELAKIWIIGLVFSVLVFGLLLCLLSLLLLRSGLWLSPLPVAIGMLFDSFVSGSVDQATHKFKTMRRELLERFTQQASAVGLHAASLPAPARKRRVSRHHKWAFWGARHLPRVLGGDICEHVLARKNGAAALLALWTVVWISTAVFALHLAWNA